MKSVVVHFFFRGIDRPIFTKNTVGGDHHSSSVLTVEAMHIDLFIEEHFPEHPCGDSQRRATWRFEIAHQNADRRDPIRDRPIDFVVLFVVEEIKPSAFEIDDDFDPEFAELDPIPCVFWSPTAKNAIVHLSKILHHARPCSGASTAFAASA